MNPTTLPADNRAGKGYLMGFQSATFRSISIDLSCVIPGRRAMAAPTQCRCIRSDQEGISGLQCACLQAADELSSILPIAMDAESVIAAPSIAKFSARQIDRLDFLIRVQSLWPPDAPDA
jgi:hypothetical protein